MKAELMALAAKVEALTGPSRETDMAIAKLLRLPTFIPFGSPTMKTQADAFTGSLDAARSLVPEGCHWVVSTGEPGPYAWVGVFGADTPAIMAATPELALTAAALRARAEAGE